MAVELVLQIISLLWLIESPMGAAAAKSIAKPGCKETCGNIRIFYPFGIGRHDCYFNEWYEITCNNSKPFLHKFKVEVLNISELYRTLTIKSQSFSACKHDYHSASIDLQSSPFRFYGNTFVVVGCKNALLMDEKNNIMAGCTATCEENDVARITRIHKIGCYGINCCQSPVPDTFFSSYNVNTSGSRTNCTSAFLVQDRWFEKISLNAIDTKLMELAPLQMIWTPRGVVKKGYSDDNIKYCYDAGDPIACGCQPTYEGNPYLPGGCTVIPECARCKADCYQNENGTYYCNTMKDKKALIIIAATVGGGLFFLLLSSSCFGMYKWIKRIKENKLRKKFFQRNGGLLLQQHISSTKNSVEKTKIFPINMLGKATENFNINRILGHGGQGTVYKGMFTDGKIVAIKKSKITDESQIEHFINEVVILSQINHRNIVKLLGCCLESEVPLLVYEFIPNGTLFQLIHNQGEEFPLSWELRLQISTEVAGALAYLHSASSAPIYHRDIKSNNILLDEKYRAKIADFGTSRSVALDQTHLTTLVQGTFGYLDPEYFGSSQFTEKSDVYSFGVVLAELLTGQRPISATRSQEVRNLAAHFVSSLEERHLFDVLDARVVKEGNKEDIIAVAELAKGCLNQVGKQRPTMKEVLRELERIQISMMSLSMKPENFQNGQSTVEVKKCLDSGSTSKMSCSDHNSVISVDSFPLLFTT